MATLDEAVTEARDQHTLVDSVVAFVAKLLSGEKLSPAVQAKVDELVSLSQSGKAKLSAALVENTPVPAGTA